MTTIRNYLALRMGIGMPSGEISAEWFAKHSLPMIVSCSCCQMTMALPSAWIDENGYLYCDDCAGAVND